MAIENYWDKELGTHAVAFIEMIGVSSVPTRAYLRCLALVREEASQDGEDTGTPVRLTVANLLRRCEEAIAHKAIDDPELLVDLEAMTIVAKSNGLPYPEVYLRERLLVRNDWFRFLLLVDYLSYPQEQIVELCRTGFREARIGSNLMTALLHQPRAADGGREGQTSSSSFTSIKRRSSLTPRRRRRASSTTADSSGHSSISSETDATSIGRSTSGIGHTITTASSPPLQLQTTDISTSSSCSLYEGACFLSERYDTDLVSVVLLCSNESNPYTATTTQQLSFDFVAFKSLILQASSNRQSPTQRYPYTYQNLLDRA
uniref:Spatacsin C-terminal domain-containing protein n=1 Tax=Anopheles maculatus TaxID=74869 RepID=A0A182SV12_9DIPT